MGVWYGLDMVGFGLFGECFFIAGLIEFFVLDSICFPKAIPALHRTDQMKWLYY